MAPRFEQIPAAPFARWLNERIGDMVARSQGDLDDACSKLARQLGWDYPSIDAGVRKLYRYRKQQKGTSEIINGKLKKFDAHTETFPRAIVEEALHNAGVLLEELYADIARQDEVVLEPERWCLRCEETKTPINGLCPFCETTIGPETGQRLHGKLRAA